MKIDIKNAIFGKNKIYLSLKAAIKMNKHLIY